MRFSLSYTYVRCVHCMYRKVAGYGSKGITDFLSIINIRFVATRQRVVDSVMSFNVDHSQTLLPERRRRKPVLEGNHNNKKTRHEVQLPSVRTYFGRLLCSGRTTHYTDICLELERIGFVYAAFILCRAGCAQRTASPLAPSLQAAGMTFPDI